MITLEQFQECLPGNKNIEAWYDPLVDITPKYSIDTPQRLAAFIAQCSHESGEFNRISENLNYKWESLRRVFPKYFPTDELAKKYAHQKEAIANRVYANRMGNGPESSGDGWRYRGRGLIQITGKDNYSRFAEFMKISLEEITEYMETYDGALTSACWFWMVNNLNNLADTGNIKEMTRRINGGFNGLEDRINKYNSILEILG